MGCYLFLAPFLNHHQSHLLVGQVISYVIPVFLTPKPQGAGIMAVLFTVAQDEPKI